VETLVGSTLSGYSLTRVIGSGGMGTVYLAEDKAIGQQVAIKVVKTEDSAYADIMSVGQVAERFRQEARAVASLDHLNILPLYRYGEEKLRDGMRSYMVMQYRPEGSLWAWLRRRAGLTAVQGSETTLPGLPTSWPLQADEVADYLLQAASALQYAHDRGFIHRDVKPENFLLRFDKSSIDGSYKAFLLLSDFGLAKFFSNLASNSQILGTPTYMAPEQFNGQARPESDQYALAVMVYCLLAGQPPFSGDPIHLMNQHLTAQPPSIRIFAPRLSAGIETVLDKALAKTPSERYSSITEFADAFVQNLDEVPGHVNGVQSSKPLFSLPAHIQRRSDPLQKRTDEAFPLQTDNTPNEQKVQLNSNPNGSSPAAYVAVDDQTIHKSQQIPQGIRALASTPRQAPPLQAEQEAPIYSNNQRQEQENKDGQSKQTVSRRSATRWIIGGVAVAGIGAGAASFYLSRQPGNAQPAKSNTSGSNTSNSNSSSNRPNSSVRSILHGHKQAVSSLAWSPDGSQLASGSLDRSVRLWRPGQVDASLIIQQHTLGVQAIAWEPAGTQIASAGRDDNIQICSPISGNLNQTFTNTNGVISRIAWSHDSANLFVSTAGNGLQRIILKDKVLVQEWAKATFRALALSPDGRYLALGAETGYVALLALPTLRRLRIARIHKGSIRALAWSPDSTQLASGGIDKTIQILDINAQRVVHNLTCTGIVNDIAWRPQEGQRARELAAALANGEMYTWTPDNNMHATHKAHTEAVTSISWGRQGLATGSTDKTIIIWNI